VFAELFGVADSSAAFGVGMTRTIEQGDPESFSATCEAAPFQNDLAIARLSALTSFQITFLLLAGASETRSRRHSAALL
jgi:hypothetical protein